MLVAGVDLSGRTTGTTAIAWLKGESKPALTRVLADSKLRGERGDAEITRELVKSQPSVVALDAPLALPHAVTCADDECRHCLSSDTPAPAYGSRACESKAAWAAVGHHEKPPMPMVMVAGIAFRGIYLKRLIEKARIPVIETWPMATYRALAGSAQPQDTDEAWRRSVLASKVEGLASECPEGPPAERDRLDAVAAAYAAWAHESGSGLEVKVLPDEGSIWTVQRG